MDPLIPGKHTNCDVYRVIDDVCLCCGWGIDLSRHTLLSMLLKTSQNKAKRIGGFFVRTDSAASILTSSLKGKSDGYITSSKTSS